MKKIFNLVILFIMLTFTCSFTHNANNYDNIKMEFVSLDESVYSEGNKLFINVSDKRIELTSFKFYKLKDEKNFFDKIVYNCNSIYNKLNITIYDNFPGKYNMYIYYLDTNLYKINTFISLLNIHKLTIEEINKESKIYYDLLDSESYFEDLQKEIVLNVESNNQPQKVIVKDDTIGGGSGYYVMTVDEIQNQIINNDSDNLIDIVNNFNSGVNNGVFGVSNICDLIPIDAFLQNKKFTLKTKNFIFFIDSSLIEVGLYKNYVCLVDLDLDKYNRTSVGSDYTDRFSIHPIAQFKVIASSKKDFSTKWSEYNFNNSLLKIAYILETSDLYGIHDISFTTVVEHLTNIYNEDYSLSNDYGSFITLVLQYYDFTVNRISENVGDVITSLIQIGTSLVPYVGDILSIFDVLNLIYTNKSVGYETESTESKHVIELLSTSSERVDNAAANNNRLLRCFYAHPLEYKSNPSGTFDNSLYLRFNTSNYYEYSVKYHKPHNAVEMKYYYGFRIGFKKNKIRTIRKLY